jgi:hypothetical protein
MGVLSHAKHLTGFHLSSIKTDEITIIADVTIKILHPFTARISKWHKVMPDSP